MDYKEYQNTRDAVWKLLINEHITELPISVTELCKKLGIVVYTYNPKDDNLGSSMFIDGVPTIFVKSDMTIERQRFTAAHELGHIILGHVGKYELVNREPTPQDNPIEQAANVFASRLLAPACVLWGCNIHSPEDIQKLCKISKTSAEYRMQRMEELYKRNKFLTSPLERDVYSQFQSFIEKNRH